MPHDIIFGVFTCDAFPLLLEGIPLTFGILDLNKRLQNIQLLSYHNIHNNNIAGKHFPELDPYPIDVVYTWVNGSDPKHVEAVRVAKMKVELIVDYLSNILVSSFVFC